MGCNLLAGGAPCSQKKCSVCNEAVILVRTSDPEQPINMEHTALYSGGDKTWVESLGGDFSFNNAFKPINLGAK